MRSTAAAARTRPRTVAELRAGLTLPHRWELWMQRRDGVGTQVTVRSVLLALGEAESESLARSALGAAARAYLARCDHLEARRILVDGATSCIRRVRIGELLAAETDDAASVSGAAASTR